MLEEQTTLITILKEVISNYDYKIKKLINNNDSILTVNKGLIEDFKNDVDVIINLDLKIVDGIFDELNTKESERNEIFNYLATIKKLLTLNKEENTTYEISEEQTKYLQKFFEKVDELEEKNVSIHKKNLQKISKMTNICDKYRDLLIQLEDAENKDFISNLDTIELLLNEYDLTEKTKRGILLSIMKYNENIANN